MITRQTFEAFAVPEVRSAIPDVRDRDERAVNPGADDGGAHARAFGFGLRALEDVLIRLLDGAPQATAVRKISVVGEACRISIVGVHVVENRTSRHLAADLADTATAHPVAPADR